MVSPKYQATDLTATYMKIIEILVGDDQETPIKDTFLPRGRIPDQDLMARIANAFASDGAVKLLWDLQMAGEFPTPPQPSAEDTGMRQPVRGTRHNPAVSSSFLH